MIKFIRYTAMITLLFSGLNLHAQDKKDIALEKAMEAIELMDNGKIKESIKLLDEAAKLDPDRIDYPYEKAYAFHLKDDHKGAIKILEKISDHKNVNERVFQLLGNSYDILGDSKKAFDAYDRGLKIFPNSGMIYLEKGNVHWGKNEFNDALEYYEYGIKVDPTFPSNYYRATLIFTGTTEEVWGMIYGEIFMNLERNSARTVEISKLLFDTYKSEIKFTSKTEMTVSFCQNMTINVNSLEEDAVFKMPFCMIYEPTLLMGILAVEEININTLHTIRNGFVDNYYTMGHNKTHPNVLFEYQKKVQEAGHFESYNHWILMKGDEDGFDEWIKENGDAWENFTKWFSDNGLELDVDNKFIRSQY